jgi:hypothetical protein
MLSVPYALYAEKSGYATGGGNFSHFIGEAFGGGVIFHLWKDAQGIEHGLVVDIIDLDTLSFWSNIESLIGPSAQSLWDGLANSNAIVSQPGHTSSAALQCLNSSNGGQDDWYLPAIDEMSLLWQNRFNVNKTLSNIAGANPLKNTNFIMFDYFPAFYYTSNETKANETLLFNFYTGYLEYTSKNGNFNFTKTRAIRAF